MYTSGGWPPDKIMSTVSSNADKAPPTAEQSEASSSWAADARGYSGSWATDDRVQAADQQHVEEVAFQLPEEAEVAKRMQEYVKTAQPNPPSISSLDPDTFVKRVLQSTKYKGGVEDEAEKAIDDGDSAQPLFFRKNGVWHLHSAEILYRVRDPSKVPFPAFVCFVQAASDGARKSTGKDARPELRDAFKQHSTSSLHRVDACLSEMSPALRASLEQQGFRLHLNFTSRQLEAALSVPIENTRLIALEETEYDIAPDNMPDVRRRVWERFGCLSLDDVMFTISDVECFAGGPIEYGPPLTPSGHVYKPWPMEYTHDIATAREFMADFAGVRPQIPGAKSALKFSEEFCCYLLGVGYAPFARETMKVWREAYPKASDAVRRLGAKIIREALDIGMHVCCEVSFEDSEVQWLFDEMPDLEGNLLKQGGVSGPAALPVSLIEAKWFREPQESGVASPLKVEGGGDLGDDPEFGDS